MAACHFKGDGHTPLQFHTRPVATGREEEVGAKEGTDTTWQFGLRQLDNLKDCMIHCADIIDLLQGSQQNGAFERPLGEHTILICSMSHAWVCIREHAGTQVELCGSRQQLYGSSTRITPTVSSTQTLGFNNIEFHPSGKRVMF